MPYSVKDYTAYKNNTTNCSIKSTVWLKDTLPHMTTHKHKWLWFTTLEKKLSALVVTVS